MPFESVSCLVNQEESTPLKRLLFPNIKEIIYVNVLFDSLYVQSIFKSTWLKSANLFPIYESLFESILKNRQIQPEITTKVTKDFPPYSDDLKTPSACFPTGRMNKSSPLVLHNY